MNRVIEFFVGLLFGVGLLVSGMTDPAKVLGGLTFGAGWGLAGFCPGPGIVSMASGEWKAAVFVAAMVAGMVVFGLADRSAQRPRAKS